MCGDFDDGARTMQWQSPFDLRRIWSVRAQRMTTAGVGAVVMAQTAANEIVAVRENQ